MLPTEVASTIRDMECLGFFPIPFLIVAVLFFGLRRSSRRDCPACGMSNPRRANFCRRCGASLNP